MDRNYVTQSEDRAGDLPRLIMCPTLFDKAKDACQIGVMLQGKAMRLWSIHPKYLDTKGLLALWREALLAQNVLLGKTVGYKNHPQLLRFKETTNPAGAIAAYLRGVEEEAKTRNYSFDGSKINPGRMGNSIPVTRGQVAFECSHLKNKLKTRDAEKLKFLESESEIELHPVFKKIDGEIEAWEIV